MRASAALPTPRDSGRYLIGLVCLGNICRSPTAHVVLEAAVASAGLDDRVHVDSCGTGGWHVGGSMDSRAAAELRSHGYDPDQHRAQQLDAGWFARCDVLLAMDTQNLADLQAAAQAAGGEQSRIMLFGDFDPHTPGAEVPDPYYGGGDGFTHVREQVERTCEVLATQAASALGR